MRGLYIVEPAGEIEMSNGIVPQCKMEYIQFVDVHGTVPALVVNSKIPDSLAVISDAKLMFNKDKEIDLDMRLNLASKMTNPISEGYNDDENDAIELLTNKFKLVKLNPLLSPSEHVKIQGGFRNYNDPLIVGFGEVLVDCPIEDCAG